MYIFHRRIEAWLSPTLQRLPPSVHSLRSLQEVQGVCAVQFGRQVQVKLPAVLLQVALSPQ